MTSSMCKSKPVLSADIGYLRQVFVGRDGYTDAAHDGFDDHLGYCLRALAEDCRLQILDTRQSA
jgi:hypothetical protein